MAVETTRLSKEKHGLQKLHAIEQKVVSFERKVLNTPKAIVRVEKKLIDFPFRKYFIGHKKPDRAKYRPNWREWRDDTVTMSWLGQSTVLINFYGTWIITDPIFGERCGIHLGPWTVGPRRLVALPIRAEDLPPLDLILISHAHMDHTDIPSLRKVRKAKHTVVAANTKDIYLPLKLNDVQELDWNNQLVFPDLDDLRIEAIETRHAGWRMPWDPCRSRKEKNGRSYNAYLIEKRDANGELHAIVFGGDTGYITSFRKVGDRMRAEGHEIEAAIMPIGTYNPWVGTHCNPEQAWQMCVEMEAHYIVPVHWNTFMQSSEPRYEPIQWLESVVDNPDNIAFREHGKTWTLQKKNIDKSNHPIGSRLEVL
ncbi:MAG TPA: MBL fold metallo-hydrolase [Candidatus Kapabacteria bacterium]|jgi:L-ascorbate metabolism protein UlaG (beta-lactamase superfamily)|nr:MBL fold metallo-hydrolase [Candidatus Kapabacteria bacterium]